MSRLIRSVLKFFEGMFHFNMISCFTDSMICLSWIQAISKEFKTFVQNRVSEIRSNIEVSNWFYCPTDSNPADIITRLNIHNMNNELWFNGPKFWMGSTRPESLSAEEIIDNVDYTNELKEQNAVMVNITSENIGLECIIKSEDFSNLSKLLRITAYMLRFINKLRKVAVADNNFCCYCTAEEIDDAQMLWVKENQKLLKKCENYDQKVDQLNILADEKGVLRAHGRMKNACLPFEARAPIVLFKNHNLGRLIVEHCHLKVMHNRIKQTVVEIRSRYYISKIRQFVKKCLHECIVCKKINSRPISYPGHSDLPKLRFDDTKPFSSVGIDYLGPLSVLPIYPPSDKMHKIHVVLYTCAATRGIVLDVVPNLNSGSFVNSLRRFIAERGVPRLIVSDNGSAFTAAETQSFVADRVIRWQFNLEAAPWWGGIFESLVKSVKNCLKKCLGFKRIDYNEMETVLKEIQMILNNRPLCEPVDEDMDFLTPNSILFGARLHLANDCVAFDDIPEETKLSFSKRYNYLRAIIDNFWKKWCNEYLIGLRDFHSKGNKKGGNLKLDDLVIVTDEKLPRHKWRMGRVVELVRGKDDVLRGARVILG